MQVARSHLERGEALLKAAESNINSQDLAVTQSAMACAHFAASMAVTNILLTDPPEGPDVTY